MPARDSLCKIILILNDLIIFVIHNLATLVDFVRQLHLLHCTAILSIINELSIVMNHNKVIIQMLQQFPRFRNLFTPDYWPKQPMHNIHAAAILMPDNFIRLTGLSPITFDEVFVLFKAAAMQRIAKNQRRHFSLINKNLLFLLIHWLRCYPTYPSLALLFRVPPQRISYLIRKFLPDLGEALVSFSSKKQYLINQTMIKIF